jgi:PAS domain S-box-containing protein
MKDQLPDWMKEFPGAITVCDREGNILYMNQKSCKTFEMYGGEKLLGENLAGCHPEPARSRLKELLNAGRLNTYTIEKQGIKKIVYQSPWYIKGEYMGIVELSLEIPFELQHFSRDQPDLPC